MNEAKIRKLNDDFRRFHTGSDDPGDEEKTVRVLTLMKNDEY
jgi:hypothetical protein